ncbi:MAG: RluA family pseudouridine synthase [Bacillus sp. (in: Bacteria)]|nr:RluA family pseudouridine synthase [Bacillus sp. (in: firmicutes)]MCM1425403.1 RluA family pseudouridine synthase [Eubacterium sp.]
MDKEQILYEDNDIIVCYKPTKIAVQTAKVGQRDMVSEIANYLAAPEKVKTAKEAAAADSRRPYVGIIHRLDQPVEGILVFAKNLQAANVLSRQIAENKMEKYYCAVISAPDLTENLQNPERETLTDYLYKDGKTNTSSVVSKEHKDAKRAQLYYEVQRYLKDEGIALVKIRLMTGRHHQIRVQMSHAGMSLLGDYKYGDKKAKELSEHIGQKEIALCAYKLSFDHPRTGERMVFQRKPKGEIFRRFS